MISLKTEKNMPDTDKTVSSLEFGALIRRLLTDVHQKIYVLESASGLSERTIRAALSHRALSEKSFRLILKALEELLSKHIQGEGREEKRMMADHYRCALTVQGSSRVRLDESHFRRIYPGKISSGPGRPTNPHKETTDLVPSADQNRHRLKLGRGKLVVHLDPCESAEDVQLYPAARTQSPFRGLARYRERDREFFWGRSRQIDVARKAFVKLLKQSDRSEPTPRVYTLTGPSGVGKSSILRAGLIPALANPFPSKLKRIQLTVFSPNLNPTKELKLALKRMIEDHSHEDPKISNEESDSPKDLIMQIPKSPGIQWVIAIDQFEELFSQTIDSDEQKRFIQQIVQLAKDPNIPIAFLIALRDDFIRHTQIVPEFNLILSEQHIQIPVMSDDDLRDVIQQPLQSRDYQLSSSFVNWMIGEYRRNEIPLPALQCDLVEIWRAFRSREDPETLLRQQGLGTALYRQAESALKSLSSEDRALAKKAFLAMVEIQDGYHVARGRTPLTRMSQDNEQVELIYKVLSRFADTRTRLVTLSADAQGRRHARLTHQVITTQWDQLATWISEHRSFLSWRSRLDQRLADWEADGRDHEALLRGHALEESTDWIAQAPIELTPEERHFIEASLHRQAGQDRVRRISIFGWIAASAAILFMATSAIFKNAELQSAYEQLDTRTADLRLQAGLYWTLVAEENRSKHNIFAGKLAAMKATGFTGFGRNSQTQEFRQSNPILINETQSLPQDREAYQHARRLTQQVPDFRPVWHWRPGDTTLPERNKVLALEFSPDGKWLFLGTAGGLCQLSLETLQESWISLAGGHVQWLRCLPETGQLFVGTNLAIHWLEYEGADRSPKTLGIDARGHSAAAISSLHNIALGFPDGRVVWMNQKEAMHNTWKVSHHTITALEFDDSSHQLIIGTKAGSVHHLASSQSRSWTKEFSAPGAISALSIGGDQKSLAVGLVGAYQLYRLEADSPFFEIDGLLGPSNLHWLPDQHRLLVATEGGTFHLRIPETGEGLQFSTGLINIKATDISPDGELVAIGGEEWGLVLVALDAGLVRIQPLSIIPSNQSKAALSPNGDHLAIFEKGSQPGLRMGTINSTTFIHTPTTAVTDLIFDPVNESLITAHEDGHIREFDIRTNQFLPQKELYSTDFPVALAVADNDRIVSAHASGTTHIWLGDRARWNVSTETKLLPNEAITALASSAHTDTIFAATNFGYVYIWNNGKLPQYTSWQFQGAFFTGSGVNSIALSPSENLIVSGSYDGTLQVWTIDVPKCIAVYQAASPEPIRAIRIDEEERSIVALQRSLQTFPITLENPEDFDYTIYPQIGTLSRLGYQFLQNRRRLNMFNLPVKSHLRQFAAGKTSFSRDPTTP